MRDRKSPLHLPNQRFAHDQKKMPFGPRERRLQPAPKTFAAKLDRPDFVDDDYRPPRRGRRDQPAIGPVKRCGAKPEAADREHIRFAISGRHRHSVTRGEIDEKASVGTIRREQASDIGPSGRPPCQTTRLARKCRPSENRDVQMPAYH